MNRSWLRSGDVPVPLVPGATRSYCPSGRRMRALTLSPREVASTSSRMRSFTAGSSTGKAISTRRTKLRCIQSALERYTSRFPPASKYQMRECSR